MKKLVLNILALLPFFILLVADSMAANRLNLTGPIDDFFKNTLVSMYGPIVASVGLITGLMNIKDIQGEHADYRKFGAKILLFAAGSLILMVVVQFLYKQNITV
ncbi:hypothetical protein [Flexithrix dorotheae]|uniref:hypothetical protein n=1 Tax=Flexithrix dorotheae TaxID=70993 RepID=UPI00035C43B0|nr:hypothetical protein [Flexithrix dorotheae]